MSAVQDIYSINVSNRFDLGNIEEDPSSEDLYDPVEHLKKIEEQRQLEKALKKQNKQQQANKKVFKKNVQSDQNKESNQKKESAPESKNAALKPAPKGPRRDGNNRSNDYHGYEGDENRRPPRRRNDQDVRRGGGGDRFSEPRSEGFPSNKTDQEGGRQKRDRGDRGERFRNSRGNYRGGPRNMRGNYRSDGRDDRGKREFDRRSGSDRSGVRPTDKRDGGGSHNWGTPKSELEAAENPTINDEPENWADQADQADQAAEKKPVKNDTEKEEGTEKKEDGDDVEGEVAETELTLDEWKALQNSNAKKLEFNIRKPGEGEDSAKWKNMKVLHASAQKDASASNAGQEANRRPMKNFVDVDIRFNDLNRPQKGGRGRGGRSGGTRGGRGSAVGGGSYGGRMGQQPPDVLNELEFPTLPAA